MKTKIILIILIILWMVTVFLFSNQKGEISENTSGKFIKVLAKIFEKNPSEKQIERMQLPIRKLAHFTIYALGGVLAILLLNQFEISFLQKIIYSQLIITIYAITDEFHQYFIPRKNGNYNRCINRFIRRIYNNNIN